MKEIKIHIEGMKCEGCVNRVKNVIGSLKDVSTYDVSLENKELVATVKKEKVIPEILSKIDALGFTASVEEQAFFRKRLFVKKLCVFSKGFWQILTLVSYTMDDEVKEMVENTNILLEVLKAVAMFLRVTVVPVVKLIAYIIKGVADAIKFIVEACVFYISCLHMFFCEICCRTTAYYIVCHV